MWRNPISRLTDLKRRKADSSFDSFGTLQTPSCWFRNTCRPRVDQSQAIQAPLQMALRRSSNGSAGSGGGQAAGSAAAKAGELGTDW